MSGRAGCRKPKKPPRTYWNGEECQARKCLVEVGMSPVKTWWCAGLEGTIRKAVEVTYGDETFYLDNEDHSGWRKVTCYQGSWVAGHKGLPVARVISYWNSALGIYSE